MRIGKFPTVLALAIAVLAGCSLDQADLASESHSGNRDDRSQAAATELADQAVAEQIPSFPAVATVGHVQPESGQVVLCQAQGPFIDGVDCQDCTPGREARWEDRRPLPFQVFEFGEYVGPHRLQHVPEYRLRVDDQLEFVYRLTRQVTGHPYELNVGDKLLIEMLNDATIRREVLIQPDGMITVPMLNQVRARGRTVEELRVELEEGYLKYYKAPGITVTPLEMNTRLQDLRDAVDSRFGAGGQSRLARVTPAGTIQLPGLGSVHAQGLTLDELKREVDRRYHNLVQGIEVTPVLTARAPRFVYVVGEVLNSGRYELEGPTSVMQAISLAGGWNNGGNLREVVIFRRTDDWRLMATKVDIQGALYARRPCPADELWVRDSDVVVVPKSFLLLADDFIDLVFTRGIYGVVPFQGVSINYATGSQL